MTETRIERRSGPFHIVLDVERDMVSVSYEDGARVDLDDARASLEVYVELCAGRKLPLLVDFAGLKSQTKDARHYFANDPELLANFTSVALLVDNALTRIIANFYMGINKPKIPTRMFVDRDQAYAWLEQTR